MEERIMGSAPCMYHAAPEKGGQAVLRRENAGESDILYIDVPYEGAYGMGEKYNGLNQKGKTAVNQVVEKFCRQGENTYLAAPFFVTDTGLGIYVETAEKTEFRFRDTIECEIPAEAAVHVFTGTIEEIIAAYMKIFGPALLPPKYSFGIWISANHWNSRKAVEEQLRELEEYGFPASVMVLEAWSDEATFYIWNGAEYEPKPDGGAHTCEEFDFSKSPCWPDPESMIRKLHEKDIRLVLWQIPVYKKQGMDERVCRQLELDRENAVRKALCVRKEDGSPYRIPEGNWFAGSMIPDFTNPETKKDWFGKRQYLLDMGVDGFKTDGGEFIYESDLLFSGGMTGAEAKNNYAQTYTGAYTQFLKEENVLFSRAGFAGAHRTPIHWGGDQQSENGELYSVLQAGLSAAMTGIPFWSFDIAGFAGPLPSPDLYRRATQLACFVPVMQWHSEPDGGQFKELMPGMDGNNERSPWNIAKAWNCPAFIDEMRFWHRLRINLLPYLYSTALQCCREYRPMMRPLVYDWQQDPEAVRAEDEYMLGNSLLAAPLLQENQRIRSLWLPEGSWYGLFSRKKYEGGRRIESDGEERFPVYLRAGHGLALKGPARESLDADTGNGTGKCEDLHFLLAGETGAERFWDEEHEAWIRWNKTKVELEGTEGLHITWEFITG